MYAIQVPAGQERIAVRKYSNGFIPSYISADEASMGKRLLVVPGYVFTMKNVVGAKKVPDNDWAVIEAISSPQPSTLDVKTGKLVSGPLKDLLILQINPALKSVLIRARLLDITRDYWLPVRFSSAQADSEAKADQADETAGDTNGQEAKATNGQDEETVAEKKHLSRKKIKDREDKEMPKKTATYTEEQMKSAVEKAKEIGIHAAGREAGIPWQAVMSAAKKAGISIEPKQVNKAQEARKTAKAAKTDNAGEAEADEKLVKNGKSGKAKKTAAAEKAAEKKKTGGKAVKANQLVKDSDMATAVKKPAAAKAEKATSEADALRVENAVLRSENAKLRERIDKLQKALQELI